MEHPNELDQQIENLRTLQQSYDQIAGAAEAYNEGKPALASAISAKGVQTAPTDSLAQMAQKVSLIVQQPIEWNDGDISHMYEKQLFGSLTTPNYWNLYEILAYLLSDHYLRQDEGHVGERFGGILLAEYYKGYDSLALAGAGAGGAYVVSDIDPNTGKFKVYYTDATHTWSTEDDGKGNRWVAYCFAEENHDFNITDTNTSPRSIFIGRKVGTIKLLQNARTSEIVVPDGSVLKDFDPNGFVANFGRKIILRNIGAHSADGFIYPQSTEEIYIDGNTFTGSIFNVAGNNSVEYAKIANLIIKCNSLTPQFIFKTAFYSVDAQLGYLCIDAENINTTFSNGYAPKLDHLKNIVFLNTEQLWFALGAATNNQGHETQGSVYIGYKTNDKTKSATLSYVVSSINNGWSLLPDVELQNGWCKPLDVSACISLTEENMYAHILQRLKQDEEDCGDGVTITLGATNLAKLTSQDSIDLLDLLTNTYGYTFA